ncbi:hypothetical protein ACWCQN_37780 [Streptomyces sp. NPDC001984]
MNDHVGTFTVSHDLSRFERIDSAFVARCEESADAVKERWIEVALAGPRDIAQTASKIERISNALAALVFGVHMHGEMNFSGEELQEVKNRIGREAEEFEQTLDKFIFLAQAALDDDGSVS